METLAGDAQWGGTPLTLTLAERALGRKNTPEKRCASAKGVVGEAELLAFGVLASYDFDLVFRRGFAL